MGRSYRNKVRQNRDRSRRQNDGVRKQEEKAALLPLAVLAVIVIVLGTALYFYLSSQASDGDDGEVGDDNGSSDKGTGSQTGPLFISLDNIEGGSMRLSDLNGKVVVLDLMATWCGPCRVQMEELRLLRNTYSSAHLEIVSVGVDLSESASLLRSFKAEESADWPFLKSDQDFNDAFPARSIPTIYILDRSGKVAKTHVGVTDLDVLQQGVASLLA